MAKNKRHPSATEKRRSKKSVPSNLLDMLLAAKILSEAEAFSKDETLKRYIKKHKIEIEKLEKKISIDQLVKRFFSN